MRIAVLLACLVACGAPQHARPTTGSIAGLARDRDSGDPIAKVEIRVRGGAAAPPRVTTSGDRGLYDVDRLPPGRYSLSAAFAGQPLDVVNIEVRAGEVTTVDLVFTLGRPDRIRIDLGDPAACAIESPGSAGARSNAKRCGESIDPGLAGPRLAGAPDRRDLDRYRPRGLGGGVAVIEGTVNDTATQRRVPGAVVTAVGADVTRTQQTVSDDHGRFRFDALPPGVYSVSAYYTLGGRGQIEVRRSGIHVGGAEAVIVPLWIETAR